MYSEKVWNWVPRVNPQSLVQLPMDFRTKQCQSVEIEALHMDGFSSYASIASRDFFSCSLIQAESRQL